MIAVCTSTVIPKYFVSSSRIWIKNQRQNGMPLRHRLRQAWLPKPQNLLTPLAPDPTSSVCYFTPAADRSPWHRWTAEPYSSSEWTAQQGSLLSLSLLCNFLEVVKPSFSSSARQHNRYVNIRPATCKHSREPHHTSYKYQPPFEILRINQLR